MPRIKPTFSQSRDPLQKFRSRLGPVWARRATVVRVVFLSLLPLLVSMRAQALDTRAVEHPGSIHSTDNCSSCHADKTRGKSVHAAMSLPCTVCHVAETQGDMTTLTLLLSKPRICSACHREAESEREHNPIVKGPCLNCHDAHSSQYRLLLRDPMPALSK